MILPILGIMKLFFAKIEKFKVRLYNFSYSDVFRGNNNKSVWLDFIIYKKINLTLTF